MSGAVYRGVRAALLDHPEFQGLGPMARWTYTVLTVGLGPAGIATEYPEALRHELAGRTGLTPRQVDAALGELERAGWIRREGRLIWAVHQLGLDPLLKLNNRKHFASVRRVVKDLPDTPLTRAFRQKYPEWSVEWSDRQWSDRQDD
jgi:hypothetical protein